MASSSGYISSPNYPSNYPMLVDCIFIINTGTGKDIILVFDDLNTEPAKDTLKVITSLKTTTVKPFRVILSSPGKIKVCKICIILIYDCSFIQGSFYMVHIYYSNELKVQQN